MIKSKPCKCHILQSVMDVNYCSLHAAAPEMLEALKAAQFDCRGKCPACAGWNMSENGETYNVHTKTCIVGLAIAKAEGSK